MAGLGDTVAELLSRARAPIGAGVEGGLSEGPSFGSNPGALRMRLHVPGGLAPRSPLVVVLHGCGQTAEGYAAGSGWVELADRYGFAVLCPEQVRANNANLCFNWFEQADTRRGLGEAESIAQMVRRAVADLDLDPARVFVTGLSAGGAMTVAMLASYPEVFAAGAVVAGLPYGAASGVNQALAAMRRLPGLSAQAWGDKVREAAPSAGRWPRIAIWHGDADTTVTPAAADALALQWRDVHGARSSCAETTTAGRHSRTTWRRDDGRIVVELHRLSGLGHGTPIAADGLDGCGSPAPWILEAGLSSSLEMARSWGLADARRSPPRPHVRRAAPGAGPPRRPAPSLIGVGETIARALKGAGLLS